MPFYARSAPTANNGMSAACDVDENALFTQVSALKPSMHVQSNSSGVCRNLRLFTLSKQHVCWV